MFTVLNFELHIASFALGHKSTSELPTIALVGLQQGLDSESLLVLAGMSSSDNSFEIEFYFRSALKELGIQLPNKQDATIKLAKFFVDEVLDGKITVIEGVSRIITDCQLLVFDNGRLMDKWNFLTIHDLFYSYEDYLEAHLPSKELDKHLATITEEIFEELRIWRDIY